MNLLQEILGIGQKQQAPPQHNQQPAMTPYHNPMQAQLNMQQGQGFIPYNDLQGGQFNPGMIPMQGSQGQGATPQIQAFNQPYQQPYNPQNQQDCYVIN